MTQSQATVEVFWTAFQAMKKSEKEAFVARLLQDKKFAEDLRLAVAINSRKKEPTMALDDYLEKRTKKK
jgi:hypothetical protein